MRRMGICIPFSSRLGSLRTLKASQWSHLRFNQVVQFPEAECPFVYACKHFKDNETPLRSETNICSRIPLNCIIHGRNHVFKVGGPISWSRVLPPFYRKNRQVYPVWCSRLHNHTLFIKKLCKKVRGPFKFWEGPGPPGPQVVAHMVSFTCILT